MTKRKQIVIGCGAVLLALFPPIAQLAGEPYFISLFSRILIYAIAAVSLDLLLGYSSMVSLGHAAFFGIGAYVVGICSFHGVEGEPLMTWPFLLEGSENALFVIPLAVLTAGFAALIIGALSLRTTGMHFIMITLAFAQMLFYFFVSLEKYGGDDGISLYSRSSLPGVDLTDDTQFYYLVLVCLVCFLLFTRRLIQSRFGLVIRGTGNNERRVNSLGIQAYKYKLVCFAIAGGGAGLAGALLANQTEYVSPGLMHWTVSGELMVMVLLGGLGSLYGPVLGAAAFIFLEHTLAMYTEHWMIYMGPLLIIAVIFAPKGLFGLLTGRRKSNE